MVESSLPEEKQPPNNNGAASTSDPTAAKRASLHPALPVPTAAEKEAAAAASSPRTSSSQQQAVEWDEATVNPVDFQGEVLSNDDLPSRETIRRIEDYTVLDRYGKTHSFKSLYTGRNVARRVLIIFVRHFFCGVSVFCSTLRVYW